MHFTALTVLAGLLSHVALAQNPIATHLAMAQGPVVAQGLALAQGSALAQGQACAAAASAFVFNPSALSYDSSVGGTTFTVALTKQPQGMVRAAFKLAGLQMNTPIVTFSPESWATPQTVTITADVGALNAAVNSIEVDIDAPCAINIDRCTASYPFTATDGDDNRLNGGGGEVRGGTCTIQGDPHFTTFAGDHFDFMGDGDFYYYKSPSVVIMGRQAPCSPGSNAACLSAISVRYLDSIVVVGKMNADDDTPHVKVVSPHLDGLAYSPMNDKKVTITTDNGFSVDVDCGLWQATIKAPATNGATGLCYGHGAGDWMVPMNDDNIMGTYVKGSLSPFAQYLGPGVAMNVAPAIGFGPNDYTTCVAEQKIATPILVPAGPIVVPAGPVGPVPALVPAGPIAVPAGPVIVPAGPIAAPAGPVLVPAGPIAVPAGPVAPLVDPGFNKNSADQQVIAPAGVPAVVAPAVGGAAVPPLPIIPNTPHAPAGGAPVALPNPAAPLPLPPVIAGAAPPAAAPILAPAAVAPPAIVAPVAKAAVPAVPVAAPAPVIPAAAVQPVAPVAASPVVAAPPAYNAAAPIAAAPIAPAPPPYTAVAPVAVAPAAPAPAIPIAPAAPIAPVAAPAPVAPAVYQAPGSSSPNALKNLLASGGSAVIGSHVALFLLALVL
ncbi:hypothetical protein HDU98_002628 [Podochytrium sp. JEL0797]|nr:hypothetical protein HDU98_002628 [Podochytrium sp. JEL0797]